MGCTPARDAAAKAARLAQGAARKQARYTDHMQRVGLLLATLATNNPATGGSKDPA